MAAEACPACLPRARTRPHDAARAPHPAQAVAALPEELQEAAKRIDPTPLPIKRRVFTETAPIKNFQAKLAVNYEEQED